MPIDRSPLNYKKEKKDYKQEFLDMVANQSGPLAAATMEQAFKHQNTQIEEAMGQGMTISDVSQTVAQQLGGPQPQPQSGVSSAIGKLLMGASEAALGVSPSQSALNMAKAAGKGEDSSLVRYRNASSALMERQYEGAVNNEGTTLVYRDPVTGQEVDPMQAQKDMEEGLGVYQVFQKQSTRAGIVEKPLNKVPDLTQEEKKYVNDARMLNQSLSNLDLGFDDLFSKYGKSGETWKAFEIEKLPYFLTNDPQVQTLKSELIYLKAAIPFLRGGKQLTPTEAKRIDVMLNPFGKNKETFKKDIQRFQNEFMVGAEVMKFGVNAGLMKRLIKGKGPNKEEMPKQEQPSKESSGSEERYKKYLEIVGGK